MGAPVYLVLAVFAFLSLATGKNPFPWIGLALIFYVVRSYYAHRQRQDLQRRRFK